MTLTIDVLNVQGQTAGTVDLLEDVFNVRASKALVHEVVTAYLANERRGTHSTKTRGEVSGGGLKPWKQKHTGNARAGSTRSPLWRHGGITFGPKPRSYHQAVPPAKRRLALKGVLSGFARDGKLKVVEDFSVAEPKTKQAAKLVNGLKILPRSVVVVDEVSPTTARALRNLPGLRIHRARDITTYDALLGDELVLTRGALEVLTRRLGEGGKEKEEAAS
jgi:large subunit ribosomal protein L4